MTVTDSHKIARTRAYLRGAETAGQFEVWASDILEHLSDDYDPGDWGENQYQWETE